MRLGQVASRSASSTWVVAGPGTIGEVEFPFMTFLCTASGEIDETEVARLLRVAASIAVYPDTATGGRRGPSSVAAGLDCARPGSRQCHRPATHRAATIRAEGGRLPPAHRLLRPNLAMRRSDPLERLLGTSGLAAWVLIGLLIVAALVVWVLFLR